MKRYALLILCCYALLLLLPLPALGILGGDPLPAPPDSSSAPPLPESSGVETEQAVFKVLDEASGTVYTYSERDFVLYTVAGEMPATYHPEALKAQARGGIYLLQLPAGAECVQTGSGPAGG